MAQRKYRVDDVEYNKKNGILKLNFKTGERTYYGISEDLADYIEGQVDEGKTINKDLGSSLDDYEEEVKQGDAPTEFTSFPVSSSNIRAIGYDFYENNLYVDFLSGSEYVYYEVDPSTYYYFMNASSKGKFLWRSIRDYYDYNKL